MKYTEKEFKEKAILMKPWISEIKEDFINTKQKLTVVCQNGHHNTILAASLVRDGRLDECPMCRVETEEDYNKNPKLCEYCGKPIKFDRTAKNTRNRKFCSHSCSAKISNKNRTKEKHCLNCGTVLEKSQTKYCTQNCQFDFQHKQWISSWKNNDEEKIKGGPHGVSLYIRRHLYEKYNNSCSVCG